MCNADIFEILLLEQINFLYMYIIQTLVEIIYARSRQSNHITLTQGTCQETPCLVVFNFNKSSEAVLKTICQYTYACFAAGNHSQQSKGLQKNNDIE